MESQSTMQKYGVHAIIIAIFLVLSAAFCFPALKGEKMLPGDMYSGLCMTKEARDYYAKTGQDAYWANNMFSGMPQTMTYVHSPSNWYQKITDIVFNNVEGGVNNPIYLFFIAMLSFYLLMLALRVNPWIGAVGGIAFAFSSYLPIIVAAGHISKMEDLALLPGLLAGIIITYRGRYLPGVALTGLFLAMYLKTAHYQIIYYSLFLIGAMIIALFVSALKQRTLKSFFIASACMAAIVLFASMTVAMSLITVKEYNTHSIRGGKSELSTKSDKGGLDKDYAFQWSQGKGETFTIIAPNLYGTGAQDLGEDSRLGEALSNAGAPQQFIDQMTTNAPTYWGPQPFTSPIYFGAVVCFLLVLSFFTIRSKHKWWLAGIILFFIMLSWGKNLAGFNNFIFDHFPLYNKFRTPSMALTIPLLLFPVMAMWGLCELLYGGYTKEEAWKRIKYAFFITGGLCVLLLLCVWMVFDFKSGRDAQMESQYNGMAKGIGTTIVRALREDRASVASKDIYRSIIFILLAMGALWAYTKDKIKAIHVIMVLGLLITIDEYSVAKRYMNNDNFMDEDTWEQQFAMTPTEQQITKDTTLYYRVFDLTVDPFNNARPSLYYKSIGGYHPAKLEIYQDLIEHQISKYNGQVLNMLNTKYIITSGSGQGAQPIIHQNPTACGNAWFVNNIQWAATADAEMNALNAPSINNPSDTTQGNFNPLSTVIIREKYKSQIGTNPIGKDSAAAIKLTSYSPRTLTYEANNTQNGFAVFSDIYYPDGWIATIDGKKVPIYCVNYVLRGLQIPAGKHKIEFSFMLPGFEKGEKIALAGSILLTLSILIGLVFAFKQNKKEETTV